MKNWIDVKSNGLRYLINLDHVYYVQEFVSEGDKPRVYIETPDLEIEVDAPFDEIKRKIEVAR